MTIVSNVSGGKDKTFLILSDGHPVGIVQGPPYLDEPILRLLMMRIGDVTKVTETSRLEIIDDLPTFVMPTDS